MNTEILFIGDPHIQVNNIPEVNLLIERLKVLALEKKPTFIVVAGDVLHDHERLHTMALNKSYELLDMLRLISPTYVLVGNHDYCSNQQYLTNNHWMNGLKEWSNIFIVDNVLFKNIDDKNFTFVPYVPVGRFQECLNDSGEDWETSSIIFAHQEFLGCKMGAITSIEGDKWDLDFPDVISGHIHSKQRPQSNIFYPGSSLQIAFGESEKNIVAYLSFVDNVNYNVDEINLNLPRKKLLYLGVKEIESYEPEKTKDKIKITLSGDHEEFKAFKKSKKYKDLISENIKIVFKPKKDKSSELINKDNKNLESIDFKDILNSIVLKQKDPYLLQVYERIINNNETSVEDVFFI
jgi:DNA repair exonuclease SbcCD nuclease subunit|uniref:Calcineurin-like phosphoesterase domain-containing protein n=1 Tax=viral metagenome TaxID=1070528 RepID=A0A6C0J2D8_9ZZZZ